MDLTITLIIVIVTSLISLGAFNNARIKEDLIFYPPSIGRGQWYRFFSCGLIHADYFHLIFNMYALYTFGTNVELGLTYRSAEGLVVDNGFLQIFGQLKGKLFYLAMYVLALGFCLLPTYFKHKDDSYYMSLGASGGVSAVIFTGMLLEPRSGVGLLFLPISIPGYIFAPLFLIISHYLAKRGRDNINHSAHIWGALFGIMFTISMSYLLSDFDPVQNFIESIRMDTGL
ncbi:MAG: rhomboid family intramembrane serine protease [Chitinophagaceae bacterium]|nr:rhomboid family intramembrane serine protease [Chitinophagaceae bacterium]